MASLTETSPVVRLPFTGSCHCKTIRYVVYLRVLDPSKPKSDTKIDASSYVKMTGGQSQHRCNCTLCHKTGMLHLRLAFAPDDFYLLAPTNPKAENSGVGAYKDTWYFCKTCGVRCFLGAGQLETTEAELPAEVLDRLEIGGNIKATLNENNVLVKKVPVWKPKREGWVEHPAPGANSYLNLNMYTLDSGQEGLDLRTFHENGWIGYYDMLKDSMEHDLKPFEGGMY